MYFEKSAVVAKVLMTKQTQVVDALYALHFSDELVERFKVKLPELESRLELKSIFIRPLIRLLIDALSENSAKLLAVYMDERLRYAPHQESMEVRMSYHRYLIDAESKVLSDMYGNENSEICELWHKLHERLFEQSGNNQINILAVGDCLLNELRVFAPQEGLKHNLSLDVRCMYFNSDSSGSLQLDELKEYLAKHSIDIIALSFFTFDAMPGFRRFFEHCEQLSESQIDNQCVSYISIVTAYLDELSDNFEGTLVLHGVSGLPLGRWAKHLPLIPVFSSKQKVVLARLNFYLRKLAEQYESCLFYDEYGVAQRQGYRALSKQVASQRKYKGMFHTSEFGLELAKYYADVACAYQMFSKCKLLLLDFDNTLWKGVIGDGEVEHYRDKQTLLIELQRRGVVLAAVSKNSPENIRWNEMTLKPEHFAIEKISWEPKVSSISQIAKELNLGLKSFIFIDDNRHERQLVESELPDVLSLDADDDYVWRYLEFAKSFPCARSTDESKRRTEMYRQQAARSQATTSSGGNQESLRKLDLWYQFARVEKNQMDRVHELVSRTNQFNTTTKRYSKSQLQEFVNSDDANIYTATLGDSYGSLGLVAVLIVLDREAFIEIDSFIMSCRAMGFGLENQLIFDIQKEIEASSVGNRNIKGLFYPTDRNSPCANLYANNKFVSASENEWVLAGDAELSPVTWLERK